jgi:hypothetical protein
MPLGPDEIAVLTYIRRFHCLGLKNYEVLDYNRPGRWQSQCSTRNQVCTVSCMCICTMLRL